VEVLWMKWEGGVEDRVFRRALVDHRGWIDRLDGRAWLRRGRFLLAYWLSMVMNV
jgi:hypothetical protein